MHPNQSIKTKITFSSSWKILLLLLFMIHNFTCKQHFCRFTCKPPSLPLSPSNAKRKNFRLFCHLKVKQNPLPLYCLLTSSIEFTLPSTYNISHPILPFLSMASISSTFPLPSSPIPLLNSPPPSLFSSSLTSQWISGLGFPTSPVPTIGLTPLLSPSTSPPMETPPFNLLPTAPPPPLIPIHLLLSPLNLMGSPHPLR